MMFARVTKITVLCLFLLMGFAGPALAQTGGDFHPPVPEIDPGSGLSAMTLLGGGILLLDTKRSKKT
jgi:hypothetical protein